MNKNVKKRSTSVLYALITVFALCFSSLAQGQVLSLDSVFAVFNGTIVNASTKEPVKAMITYESMPYGSTIGVASGSVVSFPLNPGTDYLLTVSADGYSNYVSTVKNSEISNHQLKRTIELVPTMVSDVIRLEKLIFAQGRSEITSESYEELDKLAEMLHINSNMTIRLEGHTDFRGNEKENMKLSERRVEAVKDYLVSKGISNKRIYTKAFGGTDPLARDSDAESRARNRRVEVRILSN